VITTRRARSHSAAAVLTFFHASQTSHFEISNGLPGDFSSLTRLLPQPEGLVDRTNTATDDLAPWLHLHRTKQRLHSYYRPVRQRVPRRYSIPRRVSTWESPSRHLKNSSFGTRFLTFHARAADQAHAASMPDTAWPVSGHPPDSSQDRIQSPGFDVTFPISTHQQRIPKRDFQCNAFPIPT
jgi:hypothetical protein